MPLIYSIPLPVLFLLIIAPCLAIGFGGAWLVRQLEWEVARDDNDAIVLTHAFAGVLYAVALGLLVVNVQSGYTEVKLVAMKEANSVEDMFINSQALSGQESAQIQKLVQTYLNAVIDEWTTIGDQKDSALPSHGLLEELTSSVLRYTPVTEKDFIIYSQMLAGLNDMLDMRRERLHLGRDGVGPVTWSVVTIGALITIGMTWFYQTNSPRTQYGLSCMMSVMFGLMIFLIVAMDHPLLGRLSVDSAPFKEAQMGMLAWQSRFGEA